MSEVGKEENVVISTHWVVGTLPRWLGDVRELHVHLRMIVIAARQMQIGHVHAN